MSIPKASVIALAAGAALSIAGCGAGATSGTSSSAKAPILIGMITPTSGSNALIGTDSVQGAQVAINEINQSGGVLGGRKLKLVVKDEQLSPTVTVQDLRELNSEGVNLVMGFASSADCLAADPIAAQLNMVLIGGCNDNSLTTTNFNKHFFQEANDIATLSAGAVGLIKDSYSSIKTWDVYSLDYVTGQDIVNLFRSQLRRAVPSAHVGVQVYAPLTANDVTSYISSLEAAVPSGPKQGLFDFAYGAPSFALVKQGVPAGLWSKFTVINVAGSEPTAAAIGPSFPPTWFVYDYYYKAYHNALNQKFVSDFEKAYKGETPVAWSAQMDIMINAYRDAIAKAGSTSTNKVIAALAGLKFDSIKGQVQFRASDHLMVQPVTAFKCEGDASSPLGYTCPTWDVVAAQRVTPASTRG